MIRELGFILKCFSSSEASADRREVEIARADSCIPVLAAFLYPRLSKRSLAEPRPTQLSY